MNHDAASTSVSTVTKIVSGGQTGVDQAALDAAMAVGLDHGGWCPKGRRSEAGAIPDRYQLKETRSVYYTVRTEQNVVDSDATLIIYSGLMSGGTALTLKLAKKHDRPTIAVNLESDVDIESIRAWLSREQVAVLNVAGPRASSQAGIGDQARQLIAAILR